MQQVTGKATMVFVDSTEVGMLVQIIREEGGPGATCKIIGSPMDADRFLATHGWDQADLIVVDRRFRGVGARELLEAVRTSDINPYVPIVLIERPTAFIGTVDEVRPPASHTFSVPHGETIDWEKFRSMFHYWLTVNIPCPREVA